MKITGQVVGYRTYTSKKGTQLHEYTLRPIGSASLIKVLSTRGLEKPIDQQVVAIIELRDAVWASGLEIARL